MKIKNKQKLIFLNFSLFALFLLHDQFVISQEFTNELHKLKNDFFNHFSEKNGAIQKNGSYKIDDQVDYYKFQLDASKILLRSASEINILTKRFSSLFLLPQEQITFDVLPHEYFYFDFKFSTLLNPRHPYHIFSKLRGGTQNQNHSHSLNVTIYILKDDHISDILASFVHELNQLYDNKSFQLSNNYFKEYPLEAASLESNLELIFRSLRSTIADSYVYLHFNQIPNLNLYKNIKQWENLKDNKKKRFEANNYCILIFKELVDDFYASLSDNSILSSESKKEKDLILNFINKKSNCQDQLDNFSNDIGIIKNLNGGGPFLRKPYTNFLGGTDIDGSLSNNKEEIK